MFGLYHVFWLYSLFQVSVPVNGQECDVVEKATELNICVTEIIAVMVSTNRTEVQLTTFCENDQPKLKQDLDDKCMNITKQCPEESTATMTAEIDSAKSTLDDYCNDGESLKCAEDMQGCMAELITVITANGIDPQLASQIMANPYINQTQLCSALGDTNLAPTVECMMEVQTRCTGPPLSAPMGDEMHLIIQSIKYMCTEECANMQRKSEATGECIDTATQTFRQTEVPDEKVEGACRNISATLKECIVKASGCCPAILNSTKTGLVGALASIPELGTACPQLQDALSDLCVPDGDDTEEEGEEEEEGKEGEDGNEGGNKPNSANRVGARTVPSVVVAVLLLLRLSLY